MFFEITAIRQKSIDGRAPTDLSVTGVPLSCGPCRSDW
jgi:hypothetical protein